MVKDKQRNSVYRWEDNYVHSMDRSLVKLGQAQDLINYIWRGEGLEHPPVVKLLHKNNKTALAKADRLSIHIKEDGIGTCVLVHELAHSMTSCVVEGSCCHNERFVGVYMMLLAKYCGFNLPELMYTAKKEGVKFNFMGKVI